MADDGFWNEDGTLNRDLNEDGEPFFTDFFDYEEWQAAYSCREDPYFDFCCMYIVLVLPHVRRGYLYR